MKTTLGSPRRRTSTFAVAALVIAVGPALVSFGCNKKEDIAPAPSATQVAPPPPPPPPAAPPPAPAPAPAAPVQRAAVKAGDAGARDGAVFAVPLIDAGAVALPGLPQIPQIHPSALPGIASGIVGGIMGALPSGLIPPPPPPPPPPSK
jgi:hypothetical protein